MKKINFALVVLLLTFFACDQPIAPSEQAKERTKENTTVFEDYAVTDANKSVQAFGEAMEALEKGDKEAVAAHMQAGIDALANEGKFLEGEAKTKMERAILHLERVRKEVVDGKTFSVDELMDAIAIAEADVPHKLLSGYTEVEVEPEK